MSDRTIDLQSQFGSQIAGGDGVHSGFELGWNGCYFAIAGASTNNVIAASVIGDTNYRITMNAAGTITWGSGTGATDTTFGRLAASILGTTGTSLSTGPTVVAPGGGGTAGTVLDSAGRIVSVATSTGVAFIQASLTTDTTARLSSDHTGTFSWGAGGSAATDVTLGRDGNGGLFLNTPNATTAYLKGGNGTNAFQILDNGGVGLIIGGTTTTLGFFSSAGAKKQSGVGSATGYSAGTTAATFHSDDKYTGNVGTTAYTINGIVAALKNYGLIAS